MKVLMGEDLKQYILTMIEGVVGRAVDTYTGQSDLPEDWDIKALNENMLTIYHKPMIDMSSFDVNTVTKDDLKEFLYNEAVKLYDEREVEITPERMREVERVVLLRVIDQKWMDHIDEMDQMRQGITLRAYAQRDPIVEYKFLSYEMFDELGYNIQLDTVRAIFNVRVAIQPQEELKQMNEQNKQQMTTNRGEAAPKGPVTRTEPKLGRNDPCHCGSGKKYK